MNKLILGLLCAALILPYSVKADLPVHCLKHHITGSWNFMIEEPKTVTDPFENTCGHEYPDNPANSYLAYSDKFQSTQRFMVELTHGTEVKSDGK